MSATLKRISVNVDDLNGRLDKLGKTKATPAVELKDAAFTAKYDQVKAKLDELSKRTVAAKADLQDKDALAKATLLQARLDEIGKRIVKPKIDLTGLTRAEGQLLAVDAGLDKLRKSADDATGSVDKLAGNSGAGGGAGAAAAGSGLAWLIGAGVALAPVVATAAVGLTGLGAAAYGIYKPISNAQQATGGLARNLHTLDPLDQQVARSLLALGHTFGNFQQSLKPALIGDFTAALALARNLMTDIRPVSLAVGQDLAQLITGLSKTFQGAQWQQFFQFMATTGSQDLKQFDMILLQLVSDLPGLVEVLQPVTKFVLGLAGAATQVIGPVTRLLGALGSGKGISNATTGIVDFIAKGVTLGLVTGNKAAPGLQKMSTAALAVASAEHSAALGIGNTTLSLGEQVRQLNLLAGGYKNALTNLEGYVNAQIAEGNDLHSLNSALKLSHDRIGLKTQAERNSYAAAQTYIQNTLSQGDAALKAHKGIDAQITSISNALPALEKVRGKTSEYRQELQLLKQVLDKLQAEKLIKEQVTVFGVGHWQVNSSGTVHGVGGHTGAPVAMGGLVTGGIPGQDSVLLRAMPGEVIVPTRMVRAGAVDHLRGQLPGFASGGIVPSYGPGSPAGLPPWTSADQKATVSVITNAIAKSFASSFAASMGGGGGSPGFGIAPSGPLQSYARALLAAYGWSSQWAAFNDIVMRESGWNVFATNPTSGAYGIPQALPPGKMASAGADWRTNGFTQLRWMMGYLKSRWGSPNAADFNERTQHWYGSGLAGRVFSRPTLIGVGEAGPERVDVTPLNRPGAPGARVEALLQQLIAAVHASSDRTGRTVGDAINGAARAAVYGGRYSTR
jgi:hypothetical protein